MTIANRQFDLGTRTFVWGILNVTPDSFFDGGKFASVDLAVQHALDMIAHGADIIDIGGQSTRPGHSPVSAQCELDRVLPVVKALRAVSDIPISVDTYFGQVAEGSLQAGANIINDIWGLKVDPQMASIVARHKAFCCIMHNSKNDIHNNIVDQIITDLNQSVQFATANGIPRQNIILDPGIGFAKDKVQSMTVLKELSRLKDLKLPILLGVSNKSVFQSLGLQKGQRQEATIAASVHAASVGIDFVRVHDVKGNKRALLVADAIYRKNNCKLFFNDNL